MPSGKIPTALLLRSALAGWVAMIAIDAVWTFLLPHGPHFAQELGRLGAFIIFGSVLSASYLADFVFLAIPMYLLFYRRIPRLRPWLWTFCGIVLFLLSLLIWWAVYGADSKAELLFWAVMAGPAGAVSFYVLAPSTTPKVDSLSVKE